MLKSYEAIYDNGHIQWLGISPRLKQGRVLVVIAESDSDEELRPIPNGARLAQILRETDPQLMAGIAEKFGDPIAWQREQRTERTLPGREEN